MKSLLLAVVALFTVATSLHGQNSIVKLEGQVVCCAECWAEADRNKVEYGTAANLLKAKSCIERGDPTLLAVREGDEFKLYQLALGVGAIFERGRHPGASYSISF